MAVLIVGTALHFIKNKHVLAPAVAGLEKLLQCSVAYSCAKIGYVTAKEGTNNAQMSTDDNVAFDRRQVKGHVRNNPVYRQRLNEQERNSSIFSSSSSTSTQGSSSNSSGSSM